MSRSEFATIMRPDSKGKATNLSHNPRNSKTFESSVFAASQAPVAAPTRSSRTFDSSFKFDTFGVASTDERSLPFRNPTAARHDANKSQLAQGMTADTHHFAGGIKIVSRPSTAAPTEGAEEGPVAAGARRVSESGGPTRRHYGLQQEASGNVAVALGVARTAESEGQQEVARPRKKHVDAPQVTERVSTKRMFDSAGQQEDHITEAYKAAEEGRTQQSAKESSSSRQWSSGDKTIPNVKSATMSGRRSFGYTNQTSKDNVLGSN